MTYRGEWVDRTGEREVTLYEDVRCDGCAFPMEPADADQVLPDGRWTSPSADRALPIKALIPPASAHYAGTREGETGKLYGAYLCRACADRLFARFPCFGIAVGRAF